MLVFNAAWEFPCFRRSFQPFRKNSQLYLTWNFSLFFVYAIFAFLLLNPLTRLNPNPVQIRIKKAIFLCSLWWSMITCSYILDYLWSPFCSPMFYLKNIKVIYKFLTVLKPVLWIREILGWIRIRIRGSMPLTNGSGSGSWIRILLFSSLTFKMPAKN
jgi:hypothetical protein